MDGKRKNSENAALPHGSGTDRILGENDLILIDVGGKFHGYVSDVTRVSVFFFHFSKPRYTNWGATQLNPSPPPPPPPRARTRHSL